MAIAPSIDDSEPETAVIASCHPDGNRLYLVFSLEIDPDMPPLAGDFSVASRDGGAYSINSMDVQICPGQTVLLFLLDQIVDADALEISYRPSQWLMCDVHSGDSVAAFSQTLFMEPVEALDPSLRLKAKFGLASVEPVVTAADKALKPEIRSAHEFLVQLQFNEALDTSIPPDINDFRAELKDRWLRVTHAKYIKVNTKSHPAILLELSEPMDVGERITLAYRSPRRRLRTLEAEPLAPFTCDAIVSAKPLKKDVADDALDPDLIETLRFEMIDSRDPARIAADLVAEEILSSELAITPDLVPESSVEPSPEPSVSPVTKTPGISADGDNPTVSEPSKAQARVASSATAGAALPDKSLPAETVQKGTAQEPAPSNNVNASTSSPKVAAPEAAGSEPATSESDAQQQNKPQTTADGASSSVEAPAEASSVAHGVLADEANAEHVASEAHDSPNALAAADASMGTSLADKTARVERAIGAKGATPRKQKAPLSLAAKMIYLVPIVVLVWLLGVVGVFLGTLVFDFELGGGTSGSANSTSPAAVLAGAKREPCSVKSPDGSVYEGECAAGERDGYGVYAWSSGNRYEGEWAGGMRHGKGKLIYATGAVYEGEYRAGREHGRGTMIWPNGARYEGAYKDGRFHGKGVYLSASGNRYEGIFEEGSMTQDGACTMKSGESYPGPCRAN